MWDKAAMFLNIALFSTLAINGSHSPHLIKEIKPSKVALNAIDRLRSGNQRFVQDQAEHGHQDTVRRTEVAKGQKPFAIVLTCADSRVSPEIVFDQGLGDLFVLRVAGNIAEPGTMASIEYAVEHLDAHLLVVLGHERCGAVKAAVDTFNSKVTPHHDHDGHAEVSLIPGLVSQILPSVQQTKAWKGSQLDNSIAQNVLNSAKKVSVTEPLKKFISSGKLTVVGAVYDLDSGVVKNIFLNKAGKRVAAAKAPEAKHHH